MEFSPELKTELKKALLLSGFATLFVMTILLFQYRANANRSEEIALENARANVACPSGKTFISRGLARARCR
ncbi:MAG: hypothetical protein EOP09_14810 [Proteobacteria bacterium]|nr:MAG: hypothetical protein EOP09_14810 [Pseudomonadota bacterium]